MNIKSIFKIFFVKAFLILIFFNSAHAKVYIELSAPTVKRLPIAIQEFRYGAMAVPAPPPALLETQKTVKAELYDALTGDLRFSNLFTFVKKEAFLEDASEKGVNFANWRASGADALIKGEFTMEGDRLIVDVRLYDCVNEKEILAKRYVGGLANPRRLAHYFADQIYEELTGKKGIFTTKILFVSPKSGFKEIYVSDYDGKNTRQITRNKSINLTPQWSPDGKQILYTSYKKGWPCLYLFDLSTGLDLAVSDKPGINMGGRFSPDGKSLALTLSAEKSPELFLLNLASKEYKKLTDNYAVDVSPTWSPDGKQIAYMSDTSGNPHIFVLELFSGNTKRITFNGKYNASPAWSPDGKIIAFARMEGTAFNVWVKNADSPSAQAQQLTFEADNRTPSWSPDGRYILFSRTTGGVSSLYMMLSDGTGLTKIMTGASMETSPVWSPYLQ